LRTRPFLLHAPRATDQSLVSGLTGDRTAFWKASDWDSVRMVGNPEVIHLDVTSAGRRSGARKWLLISPPRSGAEQRARIKGEGLRVGPGGLPQGIQGIGEIGPLQPARSGEGIAPMEHAIVL